MTSPYGRTSHKVEKLVGREIFDHVGEILGGLVVASHEIRQAGVRIRVDEALGNVGQALDIWTHEVGAESAIEANAKEQFWTT